MARAQRPLEACERIPAPRCEAVGTQAVGRRGHTYPDERSENDERCKPQAGGIATGMCCVPVGVMD